jgi:hypothetical protein
MVKSQCWENWICLLWVKHEQGGWMAVECPPVRCPGRCCRRGSRGWRCCRSRQEAGAPSGSSLPRGWDWGRRQLGKGPASSSLVIPLPGEEGWPADLVVDSVGGALRRSRVWRRWGKWQEKWWMGTIDREGTTPHVQGRYAFVASFSSHGLEPFLRQESTLSFFAKKKP